MGIKESLKNVAADYEVLRQQYMGGMLPKYAQTQKDIQGTRGDIMGYKTGTIDPFTSRMTQMATDPSKRGYGEDIVNAMRGRATGAIAGAKRSAEQDVNRQIAAAGMGNTGMGINQARNLGRTAMTQQRMANYDVDIAAAEAQRQDLWNAINAETQGMNLGQQSLAQALQSYYPELAALSGEGNVYGGSAQMLAGKIPALTGAHDVSFWGDWGDVTGGLANLLYGGGGSSGIDWGKVFGQG